MFRRYFIHAVLLLFLFLFFQILPSHQQTSFNFPNFADKFNKSDNCSTLEDNIVCLQGNASFSTDNDGVIDLTTKNSFSTGRAVYPKPVRIYNNSTESTASFTTEFTFLVQKYESVPKGDGFVFFISPYSSINEIDQGGGRFGLVDPVGGNNFVAVEFDVYKNDYDPDDSHVGIDIRSVRSETNVSTNFSETFVRATVDYNAATKSLSVSLFSQDRRPHLNGSILLSHDVDLQQEIREANAVVGFSGTTGSNVVLSRILNWTFTSTLEDKKEDNNIKMVVGISSVVGLLVLLVCVILVFLFFRKKSKNKKKAEGYDHNDDDDEEMHYIDDELEDTKHPTRFPYEVLAKATDNFNAQAKIGEGGFGSVYRGFLSGLNLEVAIKRVSRNSKQGKKEYVSEIKIISKLRHKNLVQLVGWCHQRSDLLLVYELMPKGSLDFHLFNKTSFLSWRLRYKIALELASGLLYLHEEWEQCVVHRDVKSSNVMLDSSFNAKLGDFGLARLSEHGIGLQTTFMAGTLGYMAPECLITGKASKEADVYSFGVVALEIACGRKSIDHSTTDDDQVRLVEWVWGMYGKGMLLEAIDKRFKEEEDVVEDEEARRLMVVGLWCAHPNINHRPSIRQAISVLNLERPTPNLPPNMPLASYIFLDPSDYEFYDGTIRNSSFNSTSTSTSSVTKKSSTVPLLSTSSSKTFL